MKTSNLSKRYVRLFLILAFLLSAAPSVFARWSQYASYNVYYAEGPSTGKRIVCYADCVAETDNCIYKYVFDGVTLYVEYEYNALEEYDTPKKSKIVNTFKRLYPYAFSNEDNNLSYAASKDGKYELYVIWGMGVPNAWLYRNGRFDSALLFK